MAPPNLSAEEFADKANRAKTAFQPFFLAAVSLYPFFIVFSTTARVASMSLLVGQVPSSVPGSPNPDLWNNADRVGVSKTLIAFSAVTVCHVMLVGYLCARRFPGSVRLSRRVSWVAPLALVLCTIGYFLFYLSLSRYGIASVEWTIFWCYFLFVIVATLAAITLSPRQTCLVTIEDETHWC